MKTLVRFLLLVTLIGVTLSYPDKLYSSKLQTDEVDLETSEDLNDEDYDEKRPYSFAWKASRYYNGAPDREHIEERNEDGITRGVFRYVDPRQQIQEVVYHSDSTGFHVDASNLPQDTPVVSEARFRHLSLFEQIKKDHERIAKERQDSDEEKEYKE